MALTFEVQDQFQQNKAFETSQEMTNILKSHTEW